MRLRFKMGDARADLLYLHPLNFVEKETTSGNIIDWKVLKRIFRFVKPYKWKFAAILFLTIILGFLSPLRAKLIQHTLDKDVVLKDYHGLLQMIIVLLGLLLLQSGFQYVHTYFSGWIGQHVIRDIRVKLFTHLLRFQLSFFDRTPIGRLVTRTVSDVETLAAVFSEGLAAMAGDLLQVGFILIFMFAENWKLALISLCTLPLMTVATYIFKEKVKASFNDVRNAVANLNTFVQEHITGMGIVQIFGSEKTELEKFKKINAEHRDANLRSVLYYSIYFPVAEIISAVGIGLLIWYGARGIIHAEETGITAGTLTAFIMYIQMFFRPIRMIADRFNTLQMGIVSTSRIIRLLDDHTPIMKEGSIRVEKLTGAVKFEHVWFAYQNEEYVLKDISIDVKPGEVIALVGATGAGKSSIVNLLNRFYEVRKGSISIDGAEVREYALSSLRKNIGVVLQDVFLFSDTIRQNIILGDAETSDETIMQAADLVGARKFIERLPGGLDYNVMERGATLSVGQRQLISFIRAMIYNPSILVMDEATASVDSETEAMIQEAISKMMSCRTSFVIAHRLSTIQKANKILVMDHGEIKECGIHQELLKKNGLYSQLHKMQYRGNNA